MKTTTQWTLSLLLITNSCFGMDSLENYEDTPPTEPYSQEYDSQDSAPLLSQDSLGSFKVADTLSLSAAESAGTDDLWTLLKEIGEQEEAELKKNETLYMQRLASLITRLNPNLDEYELFTTNKTLLIVWNQYKNR